MFARFRNLFSKNKMESEVTTNTSIGNPADNVNTSVNVIGRCEKSPKLESLNFLKSIVENEQESQANNQVKSASVRSGSLSEEVAELLSKNILKQNEILGKNEETGLSTESIKNDINGAIKNFDKVSKDITADKEIFKHPICKKNEVVEHFKKDEKPCDIFQDSSAISNNDEMGISSPQINRKEHLEELDSHENDSNETTNDLVFNGKEEGLKSCDNKNDMNSDKITTRSQKMNVEKTNESYSSNELLLKKQAPTDSLKSHNLGSSPVADISYPLNIESNIHNLRENSTEISDSSKFLSQPTVKENHAHSTTKSLLRDLDINFCNNSSIVVEDLPAEITTTSPPIESTISGSSSSTSTLESYSISAVLDPSKIIVNPIDNNALACNAITHKLIDIAEVAESLDAVIRDVQENVQNFEADSNPSTSHKELCTLRGTSSEDLHSRSTEDGSFVTASEGNFTPSSSSFQTASGRTSSYISCDKNSFDASEADDSTYAFEMPELTSPLNISFEGSEQSYLSAQPLNVDLGAQDKQKAPTKLMESVRKSNHSVQENQITIADIEELHSGNVTPTPGENYDERIPIELETALEVTGIADAPSMQTLTDQTTMPMSRTPEVSASTSNNCSNQNQITSQLTVNMATDSNDQQEQYNATNNYNNIKPNAAWRRSKYYENITKQTIKGFL